MVDEGMCRQTLPHKQCVQWQWTVLYCLLLCFGICGHSGTKMGPFFQVYHYAARMNEQKDAILQAISSNEEATGVMVFLMPDCEWLRDDLLGVLPLKNKRRLDTDPNGSSCWFLNQSTSY